MHAVKLYHVKIPHVWACFRFGGAFAKIPERGNLTIVRHAIIVRI